MWLRAVGVALLGCLVDETPKVHKHQLAGLDIITRSAGKHRAEDQKAKGM